MSVYISKIISGGQTGADQGGLEAGYRLGLKTGGVAPAGYKTETGTNLDLRDKYGLTESKSANYQPRTKQNVKEADVTIWFGDYDSPGGRLTTRYAEGIGKQWIIGGASDLYLPVPQSLTDSLTVILYDVAVGLELSRLVVNVAGNRESKYPGIYTYTLHAMIQLISTFNTRFGPNDKKVVI